MNQNINIDLNKSEPTKLDMQKKKDKKKRKILIGNIIFICFLLFTSFVFGSMITVLDIQFHSDRPLFIASIVISVFSLIAATFLSMRKKIGLIMAYIINVSPTAFWMVVGVRMLYEAFTYSLNSAETDSIITLLPVCLVSIIFSVLYLIYYIKRRKYFK